LANLNLEALNLLRIFDFKEKLMLIIQSSEKIILCPFLVKQVTIINLLLHEIFEIFLSHQILFFKKWEI
jgi:hypothetical protein